MERIVETEYPEMSVALVRGKHGNLWRGTCPYCGEKHTHGAPERPNGQYQGHRASHCRVKTPQDRGYILVWDGVIEKK